MCAPALAKEHASHVIGRKPRELGSVIAGFKSATTKQVNVLRELPGTPVWQRNYYEHVIRNERDLERVREYIQANVARWAEDAENPENARNVEEPRAHIGAGKRAHIGAGKRAHIGAPLRRKDGQ